MRWVLAPVSQVGQSLLHGNLHVSGPSRGKSRTSILAGVACINGGERSMMRRETFSSSGEAYYRHVESGFDDLAASYDTDIAGNEITIRMREIFRRALLDAFHPGERVVEIGCGTGIDALWLAEQGLEVVATDISQGMVDRVAEKAREISL